MLYACGSGKQSSIIITETLEVASFKVSCQGTNDVQCMQVRKKGQKNWAEFNIPIKGFEYQQGYKYTIEVIKENLDPTKVPGTVETLNYTLIKQIRKQKENTIRLHDVWVVQTINDIPVNDIGKQPQIVLELQLNNKKILGNDSCNKFFGAIEQVDDNNLQFGLLGRTKKMCPDMTAANLFYDTMQEVDGYRIEKLSLYLLNENDEEIMKLKKVD
ncbi:hypothetical protein ULMS_20390 [Patiriisocius marinistellae]|uniref:DUF4377 domain-containing protein n=2 Tax=Patiriisocius marinistellae TaxID=2494560 RepID=A0A5J4G2T3_9FLAO|nr:hypothetical protein ULMS_20390 [Patiriisocius marinistellae]